ncbi:F-box [Glarea lozoyensis ATCC 20868]|uniref:F-box n=1 Tax=Glarea lozoyensis (strain ATCC 20868 / MF5171) TaxID=1116229 RepID=S3DE33_GLAL2|nr:F-box [Glarea lozoyensis ATCC 20868]EPE24908.1 F-box [Glarea lozoyensis ATCC 20868]
MAEISRMFLLPEILTQILLHIPPRDLITSCNRVNTHWNNIIANSCSIRQLLFFSSSPQSSNTTKQFNTLLIRYFPKYFPDPVKSHFKLTSWQKSHGESPHEIARREAFTRKGASWRDMFPIRTHLTESTPWNNPSKPLVVTKTETYDGGQTISQASFASDEPWTMSRLYDVIEEAGEGAGNVVGDWTMDWDAGEVNVRHLVTCEDGVDGDRSVWRCEGNEGVEVEWRVLEEFGEDDEGYWVGEFD